MTFLAKICTGADSNRRIPYRERGLQPPAIAAMRPVRDFGAPPPN